MSPPNCELVAKGTQLSLSFQNKSLAKAYNGILQAILRLRLLCNNGTQRLSDSVSDAPIGPRDAGTLEKGKIACAFCSCEVLLPDTLDNVSPGASPQSLPDVLCLACLLPNEVGKSKGRRRVKTSKGTSVQCPQRASSDEDQNPPSMSQNGENTPPPTTFCTLRGHSSKLYALVSNIEKTAPGNKR